MNASFGIYARPSSAAWSDIRKGPSFEAVREHLHRIVNFRQLSSMAGRPKGK
jgi:hypothetical protein